MVRFSLACWLLVPCNWLYGKFEEPKLLFMEVFCDADDIVVFDWDVAQYRIVSVSELTVYIINQNLLQKVIGAVSLSRYFC